MGLIFAGLVLATPVLKYVGVGEPEPSNASRLVAENLFKSTQELKAFTLKFEWLIPKDEVNIDCIARQLADSGFSIQISHDHSFGPDIKAMALRGTRTDHYSKRELEQVVARVDRCTQDRGVVGWHAAPAPEQ